jgi:uncharacterized protein (DUF305 family)
VRFVALVGLVARTMAAQTAPDTKDVALMQGMIAHHAQALAMVALIPSQTSRQEIHLIGERIRISRQDEIALMQHWLQNAKEPVPTVDSNHVVHMPGMEGMTMMMPGMEGMTMMMPGMLTPEQMTQLAQAQGPAFDQAPEVFTFAPGANADQRAEILRVRSVLNAISNGGSKS